MYIPEVRPMCTTSEALTSIRASLILQVTVKSLPSVDLFENCTWSLEATVSKKRIVGTSEAKRTKSTVLSAFNKRPLAKDPTLITPFNFIFPSKPSLTALRHFSTMDTCFCIDANCSSGNQKKKCKQIVDIVHELFFV